MSDAQAKFVATLDSSGVQSGAKSGLTALQRMGMEIQKRSKDLAALKAAQERLAKSAGVQEYLKRQKELEKADNKAAQLSKKLATAQENLDIAKQANVSEGDLQTLTAEVEKAKAAYESAREEAEKLAAAQANLAKNDASVTAYKDQSAVIKQSESELADLQSQYNAAGGSASDLAEEIKEPKAGIMKLAEEAKKAGGPIGSLGGILEQVGNLKAAGPLLIVAAIIAIAAAALKAYYALGKLIVASADAAKNAARARLNAAMGSEAGAKEIASTMAVLRENTAASKEEAQALASELYRLGDRGTRLEETALTIERFGQLGDEAKQSVKGLFEELRKPTNAVGIEGGIAKSMQIGTDMLPRDVMIELAKQLGKDANLAVRQGFVADKDQIREALSSIGEQKFAGSALEQMRSLDKLSERLRENIDSLFANVGIGMLLGALQKLVSLFDETTESGMAIREALGEIGQIVADVIESALPYVEAFVAGLILGAFYVAIAVLKVKNALGSIIPDSFTKNIDWIQIALYGAAGFVIALVAAFALLYVALLIVTFPFWSIIALIALVIVGIVMLADAIIGEFDKIGASIEEMSWSEIGTAIIEGIVGGLRDGAVGLYNTMADLAKGAYDSFKSAIKSKSPSVLFRMAGRTIPQGTALGIEDDSPQVKNAAASMVSPDDMGATGSGKGGRGGGSIQFVVQAGAVVIQVQSADEIVDEGFIRQLGRALVTAAREGGLSPEPETT